MLWVVLRRRGAQLFARLSSVPVALWVWLASPKGEAADVITPVTGELEPPPANAPERRSGLVLGFSSQVGIFSGAGTPDQASKIDDPRYYVASGVLAGFGSGVFLMGALTDTFTVGFWFATGTYENQNWRSSTTGGGFRVEAFPLYGLGSFFRDLGVLTQLGVGGSKLRAKYAGSPGGDGTESFLMLGTFYDWRVASMLGGHLALGPTADYQAIVARAFTHHGGEIGLRFAFYGGP